MRHVLMAAVLMALVVPAWGEGKGEGKGIDLPAAGRRGASGPVGGVYMGYDGSSFLLGIGDSKREIIVPTLPSTGIYLQGKRIKLAEMPAGAHLLVIQKEGLTDRVDANAPRRAEGGNTKIELLAGGGGTETQPEAAGGPGAALRTIQGKSFEGTLTFTPEGKLLLVPAAGPAQTFGVEQVKDARLGPPSFMRPSGPPASWKHTSIGLVDKPGKAEMGVSKVTITEAGRGFRVRKGTESEGYHFVYQPFSGNGQLIARVVDFDAGRAGIMLKETLEAGSATVFLSRQHEWNANQAVLLARSSGGAPLTLAGPSKRPILGAAWLKLVKLGDSVRGYESPDGQLWMPVGQVTVPMAGDKPIYIGVAAASGDGNMAKSTFDNLQLVQSGGPLAASWPKGLVTRYGSVLAGDVSDITDQTVTLRVAGEKTPRKILLNDTSRLVLRAVSHDMALKMAQTDSGILLAKGDLVEGQFKGVQKDQATVSSVVLGLMRFNVSNEVAAIATHLPTEKDYQWEVVVRDGSRLRLSGVKFEATTVSGEDPVLGKVEFKLADVTELHRGGKS